MYRSVQSKLRSPLSALFASVVASSALSLALLPAGCGTSSTAPGSRPIGASGAGSETQNTAGNGNGNGGGPTFIIPDGGTTDDAGDAESCAKGSALAAHLPVYLQFVLDGSKSMNGPGSWAAAVGALDEIFMDMKTTNDMGVGAGLIVFMDEKDPNFAAGTQMYPSAVDVPIDFVSDAQLTKLVGRTMNDKGASNTPTGPALTGAYASLSSFKPTASLTGGGKKVVVLITDGAPTDRICNEGATGPTADYSTNGCIKLAGTELATLAPNGPIQTFVIGVGALAFDPMGTYDPYFLGALAVAGGSSPPGCDPKTLAPDKICFFSVDPAATANIKDEFMTAINKIRGEVASCSLGLTPEAGQTIDPTKVRVTLNDMTVYNDPVNGWVYDDPNNPTRITLHGTSCDALKNNQSAKISVILGCAIEMPR